MSIVPTRPSKPSPSATLLLVREYDAVIEIYLLRRSSASKFMPGTYVFPGGNMEASDRDVAFWQHHVDLPLEELVAAMGGDVQRLLPFAVAALRETWEEAGLLLAEHRDKNNELDEGGAYPTNSNDKFTRRIHENGLVLSISKLGRWHHWITPELMPRRFDTLFFVAPVSMEQHCQPDQRETVHGIWINPRQALEENHQGSLPLSPPTLVTLHQLLPYTNLGSLMADTQSRPWPSPIMPRLWPLQNSALIIEPWDPDYARETVSVNKDQLENDILPVGAPFSRLWRHQGICRPVRHPDEHTGT